MSFKAFDLSHDVANIISSINEVVTISSSLFTSEGQVGDPNVKMFNNIASASAEVQLGGYWQTIYDASPTASTSTALMDYTFGYATGSVYNQASTVSSSQDEKIKVFREMASVLLGNPDATFQVGGVNYTEAFFVMLKRVIMKDEVKKGSVAIRLTGTGGNLNFTDQGASTNFQQTVGGDYAYILSGTTQVAQVWYNAGVVVLPPLALGSVWSPTAQNWSGSSGVGASLVSCMSSSIIDDCVDGLRKHVDKVSFHNQTNLYSTIYFCRATNSEFNYSSNPTFIDEQKRIRVTSGSNILQSRTYITTVGLYDANDNLLAVGKVNKPITKSPDNEAVFRIRLDY
jgi:hypothetical protein